MNLNDKELPIKRINNYFVIFISVLIIILTFKKIMRDFHSVLLGTVKGESKEAALEILKTIMNKSDEIKDISELNFCKDYVDK